MQKIDRKSAKTSQRKTNVTPDTAYETIRGLSNTQTRRAVVCAAAILLTGSGGAAIGATTSERTGDVLSWVFAPTVVLGTWASLTRPQHETAGILQQLDSDQVHRVGQMYGSFDTQVQKPLPKSSLRIHSIATLLAGIPTALGAHIATSHILDPTHSPATGPELVASVVAGVGSLVIMAASRDAANVGVRIALQQRMAPKVENLPKTSLKIAE